MDNILVFLTLAFLAVVGFYARMQVYKCEREEREWDRLERRSKGD